jgi:hypothetical protein
MSPRRPNPHPIGGVQRAFDEARFGPGRTLNLREGLPTADVAVRRAESWLRERQVAAPGEDVLIITGRGRGSVGGVPVVREVVRRLFPSLRRRGVIAEVREHTQGSFIVRLATLQALVDAPRRSRRTPTPLPRNPAAVVGLAPATRDALRRLAIAVLTALAVDDLSETFVADEMIRQFTVLSASVPDGPDRETRLRAAIGRALAEYE